MNHADVDYAAITVNDKNPVKRFLQNKRLNHALNLFHRTNVKSGKSILDFGSGDGELCARIYQQYPSNRIICYEPVDNLRKQAKKKLSPFEKIEILSSTSTLKNESLDYIFCLEVFEHLSNENTRTIFDEFKRLLKKNGTLIIGVPNEIFLAALFKGALRVRRRYGEEDAVIKNILKAACGVPPKNRAVINFGGLPYILRHMGFNHREFKHTIQGHFNIERIYGSPFPSLPVYLNLEVYFVCSKYPLDL